MIIQKEGTFDRLILEIKALIAKGTLYAFNQYFQKSNIQKEVWNFLKKIAYMPNPDDRQILQSVNKTLELGYANCVNYVIVGASILEKYKIPYEIVFVGDENDNWEHVYLTSQGMIIDACSPYFNHTHDYPFKKIIKSNLRVIQGLRGRNKQRKNVVNILPLLALLPSLLPSLLGLLGSGGSSQNAPPPPIPKPTMNLAPLFLIGGVALLALLDNDEKK